MFFKIEKINLTITNRSGINFVFRNLYVLLLVTILALGHKLPFSPKCDNISITSTFGEVATSTFVNASVTKLCYVCVDFPIYLNYNFPLLVTRQIVRVIKLHILLKFDRFSWADSYIMYNIFNFLSNNS